MATRQELLIEADNRGFLIGEQKAAFDEAVRRGLIDGQPTADIGQFRAGVEEELLRAGREVQQFEPETVQLITDPKTGEKRFGMGPPQGLQRFTPNAIIEQIGMLPLRAARGLVGLGTQLLADKTPEELITEREAVLPLAPSPDEPGRFQRTAGRITGASLPFAPLGLIGGARGIAAESARTGLASLGGATGEQIGGGPGAFVGTLAGGLAPSAGVGLAKRAVRGPIEPVQETARQFAKVGEIPTTAQAVGPTTRRGRILAGLESKVGALPFSGPIRRSLVRQQDRLRNRSERLISNSGGLAREEAGAAARSGFEATLVRKRQQIGSLWRRFDRRIDIRRSVEAPKTLSAFGRVGESLRNELLSNRVVKRFLDKVEDGTANFDNLRKLRSAIGEEIGQPVLNPNFSRKQLSDVYGSITKDIQTVAALEGRDVARLFEQANRTTRKFHQEISKRLDKVLKIDEDLKLFDSLERAATDAPKRIETAMSLLRPKEQKMLAASILSRFGKPTARDLEQGISFSAPQFVRRWGNVPNSVKQSLFKQTGMLRQVEDIVETYQRIAQVSRQISPTVAGFSGVATAEAAGILTSIVTREPATAIIAAIAMGGTNQFARLLAGPSTVKWLAQSTRLRPSQIPGHLARLSALTNDPVILEGIADATQRLGELVGTNPRQRRESISPNIVTNP